MHKKRSMFFFFCILLFDINFVFVDTYMPGNEAKRGQNNLADTPVVLHALPPPPTVLFPSSYLSSFPSLCPPFLLFLLFVLISLLSLIPSFLSCTQPFLLMSAMSLSLLPNFNIPYFLYQKYNIFIKK
jgi:hypothetical protein